MQYFSLGQLSGQIPSRNVAKSKRTTKQVRPAALLGEPENRNSWASIDNK
jgi:hypothetical protein